MTAQHLTPGDAVQYFDGTDKVWKPGKYIGPIPTQRGPTGWHIVKRRRGQQTVTVSDNWLRRLPDEFNLTGHVVIFQREDGSFYLVGPVDTPQRAAGAIDEWKTIFGEPLAVLDLSPLKISIKRGDGIPAPQP